MNRRTFIQKAASLGACSILPGTAALAAADRLFLRVRISLPDEGLDKPVSFGLIADTHYGDLDDTDRPRYFRSSLANTRTAAGLFSEEKVDFAVHLGDVIQESKTRATSLEWLGQMDEAFTEFDGERHYLMGNHDLGDLSKEDFLRGTSGMFKAPNYFFDRGGIRFIIIDANFREDGVSYDRGNFSWTDSFVPASQLNWISKTLDRAKEAGLRAILFSHQCFDNMSLHHRIKNAPELRSLLAEKGNVAAVFYGHRHAGGYFNFNGIHYIGLVAAVNGPDLASAIVRITPDGVLEVDGRGARQQDWGPFAL